MNPNEKNDSLTAKADAAFRQAASNGVQRAKQTDTPVVVQEEGHVKEVPADQLELTTDETKTDDSESDE